MQVNKNPSRQFRRSKLKSGFLRLADLLRLRFSAAMPNRLQRNLVQRVRRQSRISPDSQGKRHGQLFVDVSVVSVNDAGTGIQRVVRGVSKHLPGVVHAQWDVRFVAGRRRSPYRAIDLGQGTPGPAEPMAARPGDVFLGLDYSLDAIPPNIRQLAKFRRDGGELWFVVHDLLPLQRPDWFSKQTSQRYARWLRMIASVADGFFCNSSQTEAELKQVLSDRFGLHAGYRTCVLPMGADLCRMSDLAAAATIPDVLPELRGTPFVLMVGTLEPRKGHADVLSAFDELWSSDQSALVIVGRRGWKVDELQQRLLSHPLLGKRLFWLDAADDDVLMQLYSRCEGVIVAALAEGFGLPLLEALGYGKPVLARDLPVFRQHAAHGVRYFPAEATSSELAGRLSSWLGEIRRGGVEVTPQNCSWEQTARSVIAALEVVHDEQIARAPVARVLNTNRVRAETLAVRPLAVNPVSRAKAASETKC